jgi:hypothetical protein
MGDLPELGGESPQGSIRQAGLKSALSKQRHGGLCEDAGRVVQFGLAAV